MKPKISIIIAAYNVEKYIKKCLESALKQSISDIEIILVDDGSQDKTRTVYANICKNDKRVTIINKENGGLSSARNAGLKIAKGEYIGFIDGDDWVETNMLERMYTVAKNNDAEIVICEFYLYHQNHNKLTIGWGTEYIDDKVYLELKERKRLLYPCFAWSKIYKTEFLKKNNIKFIENIIFEDNFWNIQVLTLAKKIVGLKEPLYYYRQRDNSIMTKLAKDANNNLKMTDILLNIEKEIAFINDSVCDKEWKLICKAYMLELALEHFQKTFQTNRHKYFYKMKKSFKNLGFSMQIIKYCKIKTCLHYLLIKILHYKNYSRIVELYKRTYKYNAGDGLC